MRGSPPPPVVIVDAHVGYKWNCCGTVGWNRRGMETEPDMPDAETRGSHVSYYTTVTGEGGEKVEASVDAVERILRAVQGAWS